MTFYANIDKIQDFPKINFGSLLFCSGFLTNFATVRPAQIINLNL